MTKLKIALLLVFISSFCNAQSLLVNQSFLLGRDYYVLRSGRAKMIIQADKVSLGSAFSYMLFDAQNTDQTSRKKKAFNYSDDNGFYSSAIAVKMKDFSFTALGQNTTTRWVIEDGIPSVEAVWWASGVKVKEVIVPLLDGVFKRTITLESADMVAADTVEIEASICKPATISENNILISEKENVAISLVVEKEYPAIVTPSKESLNIGQLILNPGEKKTIKTFLIVDIPSTSQQTLLGKATSIENIVLEATKKTAEKWRNSNVIETGDSIVDNVYNVSRYILPGYISEEGKMDAGIFEYGDQWVRDASNTAIGVIHVGEFELARNILEHILKTMIKDNGTTMISDGFANPDREQFDQMGELMHALKCYVDWTGDVSLVTEYKKRIIAMVERPLAPIFRNTNGMVHNRREFWERTFDDGYELAYQIWMIQGLRDAADLSEYLGVIKKATYWRKEADRIQKSMLTDSRCKLVDKGHLVKRRNVTGDIADTIKYKGWVKGAPASVESYSRLMPDATMALPIAMNLIDPKSELSGNTLAELEKLWNRRWSFGGYDRYNTSSQGDQPGPWTFATAFIMRAQHEAGQLDKSYRSLKWLANNAGGRTGAWLEEIPIIKAWECCSGLIPWTTAEVSYFVIHHLFGIKFIGSQMVINPILYDTNSAIKANIRYRDGRIALEIDKYKGEPYAVVNGKKIKPDSDGNFMIPEDFDSGIIKIKINK